MSRHTLITAIAATLLATVALAGCKKQAEESTDAATPAANAPAATQPAQPEAAEPAMPAPMTVTTIELGNAVGADNHVTTAMTTFATTDTIHAAVATDGGSAGNLTAKWTYQDGQVVSSTEKAVAIGPQVTEFSISKPDGWPTGTYTLEILQDGNVVESREFEVR